MRIAFFHVYVYFQSVLRNAYSFLIFLIYNLFLFYFILLAF